MNTKRGKATGSDRLDPSRKPTEETDPGLSLRPWATTIPHKRRRPFVNPHHLAWAQLSSDQLISKRRENRRGDHAIDVFGE